MSTREKIFAEGSRRTVKDTKMSQKTHPRKVCHPIKNYSFQFPGCLEEQEMEKHVMLYLLHEWVLK